MKQDIATPNTSIEVTKCPDIYTPKFKTMYNSTVFYTLPESRTVTESLHNLYPYDWNDQNQLRVLTGDL